MLETIEELEVHDVDKEKLVPGRDSDVNNLVKGPSSKDSKENDPKQKKEPLLSDIKENDEKEETGEE